MRDEGEAATDSSGAIEEERLRVKEVRGAVAHGVEELQRLGVLEIEDSEELAVKVEQWGGLAAVVSEVRRYVAMRMGEDAVAVPRDGWQAWKAAVYETVDRVWPWAAAWLEGRWPVELRVHRAVTVLPEVRVPREMRTGGYSRWLEMKVPAERTRGERLEMIRDGSELQTDGGRQWQEAVDRLTQEVEAEGLETAASLLMRAAGGHVASWSRQDSNTAVAMAEVLGRLAEEYERVERELY